MSPKDLKLIESIPQMMDIGIDSLKIEGRMKSIHYIATVVSVYRKVIDAYAEDPDNFKIKPEWLIELDKCANRDTAPAFFEGTPGYEEQMFGVQQNKKSPYDFCGLVLDYDEATHIATIQQRNHFKPGQEIEFFGPEIESFKQVIDVIYDEEGNHLDAARHPLQIVQIKVDHPIYPNNMMRNWLMTQTTIIGIAGGSGSGKTTVTNEIMKNLEGHSVALLAQDYYYKDQSHLTFEERLETNYDHPFAFDNDLLISNLKDLRNGQAVEVPTYDYKIILEVMKQLHLNLKMLLS